jgi:hypothetical protein
VGEEYKSWSSSLWSFLHSPATSSLLRPDTLLYSLSSNTLSRDTWQKSQKCLRKLHSSDYLLFTKMPCHKAIVWLWLRATFRYS